MKEIEKNKYRRRASHLSTLTGWLDGWLADWVADERGYVKMKMKRFIKTKWKIERLYAISATNLYYRRRQFGRLSTFFFLESFARTSVRAHSLTRAIIIYRFNLWCAMHTNNNNVVGLWNLIFSFFFSFSLFSFISIVGGLDCGLYGFGQLVRKSLRCFR